VTNPRKLHLQGKVAHVTTPKFVLGQKFEGRLFSQFNLSQTPQA